METLWFYQNLNCFVMDSPECKTAGIRLSSGREDPAAGKEFPAFPHAGKESERVVQNAVFSQS